jgi:outer membrane protein
MKEKIHYVIEAVLGIAVVVLFVLFFSNNKKTSFQKNTSLDSGAIAADFLPMAYIDVDSLMQKYTYSLELNEQITRKYENSRANLTEQLRKLQSEVADFQRKMETNAFLTQERAQSEQQRLIKKQDDLQKLEAQKSQELGEEQMRMNEDLRKTIIVQLREFNKGKGYHIIYGKVNDNILFADDTYNITTEVINYLNKNRETSTVPSTIAAPN